jgi:hypothetical protein
MSQKPGAPVGPTGGSDELRKEVAKRLTKKNKGKSPRERFGPKDEFGNRVKERTRKDGTVVSTTTRPFFGKAFKGYENRFGINYTERQRLQKVKPELGTQQFRKLKTRLKTTTHKERQLAKGVEGVTQEQVKASKDGRYYQNRRRQFRENNKNLTKQAEKSGKSSNRTFTTQPMPPINNSGSGSSGSGKKSSGSGSPPFVSTPPKGPATKAPRPGFPTNQINKSLANAAFGRLQRRKG